MIEIFTIDNRIWDQPKIYAEIVEVISQGQDLKLSFIAEGADASSLGLYDFLEDTAKKFNYDLSKVSISTSNLLESHDTIKIVQTGMFHIVKYALAYSASIQKKLKLKHFGLFIGRGNAPRLSLASYLDKHYRDQTICTYHFNIKDEHHQSNIGIEELITRYGEYCISDLAKFLDSCPRLLTDSNPVLNDKTSKLNYGQQILKTDQEIFISQYENFFAEIVCESYFTGRTFFVTEKTWRPILLRTPFIIQGPQGFLQNLKKIGFKTFDNWWSEGYDEDHPKHQLVEIKKLIDQLSTKTSEELYAMYQEMQPTLEHNYQLLQNLTNQDLKKINE